MPTTTNQKRQRGKPVDTVRLRYAPRLRFGLVCLLAVCGMPPLIAAAEEPTYLGATRCIDCHTQPSPLRQRDGASDWVQLTEAHTWLAVDKHSQAFDVLATEYSKKMGERLGIDDITNDQRCLSCHAGWQKGTPAPPHLSLGVSCESCHGASSLYDLPHSEAAWRTKSVAEKTELGMVNVRDPVRRAERCLACHLGNVAEGKLLTHAMYAAGHPPLPGIELATFARSMPPHWRRLDEKGETVRDNPEIRKAIGYRPDDLPEAKSVLIGGVAALRASLHLSADWRAATADSGDWPDFAQYDCAACHHELERPSWRQARPATGRPGKLFAPLWPTVLAELGVRHVERHDVALGKRFRQAIEQQSAADGALSDTLDERLLQLDWLPYDQAAALHILRDACELGQRPYLDFHSARQLAWAVQAIYSVLDEGQAKGGQVQQALAELTELLQLDLPATREQMILDPQRQRAMFGALGDYQPNLVNARFAKLAKVINLP